MMLTLSLLGSLVAPASAAEVVWDGHYRARGLVYNSWSLVSPDDNENSLGTAAWVDHRFRLQPTLLVGGNVSAYAQLDMLNLEPWGGASNTYVDPVTGDALPTAFADGVAPYADEDDGSSYLRNIQLTRAFADFYSPIGRLRIGRMPMHWGAGIWLNDGLTPESEFGDTSDRVQLTSRVGPVYLMGGWETVNEGYWGLADDFQSADFAVAYRSESLGVGIFNRYRYQINSYKGYTGSIWGKAELGPAVIETEVVGVFGRGSLSDDANDVNIATFGAVLTASAQLDKLYGSLELGWAHGDPDPTDSDIRTFTFDRDHNTALLMFEEPLPVLAAQVSNAANAGLDLSAVQTGEGISNAMFLFPTVGYQLHRDVAAELSVLGALEAVPADGSDSRRSYGWEVDATVTYRPYTQFYLKGTAGLFLPGAVYSDYVDADLGSGFSAPTFGGRIYATYEF
ncbi:MAG: hypothetical protein H6741_23135 [Alphaproteobacteria bacterium]|nr:hypothetical protein [Alphaproteobacteria bacterium]